MSNAPQLLNWAIVQTNGLTLLGRSVGQGWEVLSPVWALQTTMTPQGISHMALPLWGIDVRKLSIPEGALIYETSEMGADERASLARAIDRIEQAMSASKAGIIVPPTGAKVKAP